MSTRSEPGDVRPLVRLVRPAAGHHREPGRLADDGHHQPAAASAPRSLPRPPTTRQAGIVRDFRQAWEAKDINALIALLDPGATATADGGGLARAVLRPIEGAEQIARFCADLATPSLTILERTVNGQPGLVAQRNGTTIAVYAFDIADDRIKHIWAVLNPDKLRPWTAG